MYGRRDPLDLGAQHVGVLEGTRLPWCTEEITKFMKRIEGRGQRYMYSYPQRCSYRSML